MLALDECTEMLNDLLPSFPLPDWDIALKLKCLPDENEESLSARTVYDDALRRAVIYVDPRYPKDEEYFTVREIIAHELGHIAMRENQDEEYNATIIATLIIKLADTD